VALTAIDMRGHGRSEGRRGHTPSYGALLDDVDALLAGAAERHPGAPRFLYGHSLGGNIVVNHVLRRKPAIAGIVATSPWLWLTDDLKWYKRVLGTLIEPFWPTLSFSTRTDRTELLEELGLRRNAELFHNLITVRLLMQSRRAGIWAVRHANRLALPALLLHGEADPVTDPRATRRFAALAGAFCDTCYLPGVGHCAHEEDATTIPRIVDWVVRRLGD
jgi:alpha-beta hydrolase superfamily lysophospholipase